MRGYQRMTAEDFYKIPVFYPIDVWEAIPEEKKLSLQTGKGKNNLYILFPGEHPSTTKRPLLKWLEEQNENTKCTGSEE